MLVPILFQVTAPKLDADLAVKSARREHVPGLYHLKWVSQTAPGEDGFPYKTFWTVALRVPKRQQRHEVFSPDGTLLTFQLADKPGSGSKTLAPHPLLRPRPEVESGRRFAQSSEHIATSLLTQFGVRQPRVQSLGSFMGYWNRPEDLVILTSRGGLNYIVLIGKPKGNVVMIYAEPEPFSSGITSSLPTSDHVRSICDPWMKRLHSKYKTRLTSIHQDKRGLTFTHYSIVLNGYPFIGSPARAGYDFTFSATSRHFLELSVDDTPPKVVLAKPLLTKAEAQAILKRYLTGSHTNVISKITGEPELGYWTHWQKEDPEPARLVWRFTYMVAVHTSVGSRGGSSAAVIDAVTGEVIPTHVMP